MVCTHLSMSVVWDVFVRFANVVKAMSLILFIAKSLDSLLVVDNC